MIVYVTIRLHFNAGHRLHNPVLSDDENRLLYGKCNNLSGHGHNYVLEVTLRGDIDPEIGAFVNADEAAAIVWREVLDHADHRHLNTDVPFMKGQIPTSENLARAIYGELKRGALGRWIWEVKVHESENNAATYREESAAS